MASARPYRQPAWPAAGPGLRTMVHAVGLCSARPEPALQASAGTDPRALHDATETSAPTPFRATPATAGPIGQTPPAALKQGAGSPSLRLPAGIPTGLHVAQIPAQLRQAKPSPSTGPSINWTSIKLVRDRTSVQPMRARAVRLGVLQPQCPLAHRKACAGGALSAKRMPRLFKCAAGGLRTVGCRKWAQIETGQRLCWRVASLWPVRCGPHPVTPLHRARFSPVDWSGAAFRLHRCFSGMTPRPAPWLGNGNRSCCFPGSVQLSPRQ